jgi:hypothetical protein
MKEPCEITSSQPQIEVLLILPVGRTVTISLYGHFLQNSYLEEILEAWILYLC